LRIEAELSTFNPTIEGENWTIESAEDNILDGRDDNPDVEGIDDADEDKILDGPAEVVLKAAWECREPYIQYI
jgi:hypothetical protein